MGCDGGSIPKRDELVRTKKAPEKANAKSQLNAQWSTCSLSKQKLAGKVVACYLGRLYNKRSIIEYLGGATEFGDADIICPHITSLKDVINLTLTENPMLGHEQTTSIVSVFADKVEVSAFICPISQKEMNGHASFCFSAACGCVVSKAAYKSVKSDACLVCNTPFSPEDLIIINPTSTEDIAAAQERLAIHNEGEKIRKELKLKEKAEKKRKKAALSGDEPQLITASASDEEKKPKRVKTVKKVDQNIMLTVPDLDKLVNKKHSKAVSSLFLKKDKNGQVISDKKVTYMTMGTFNRYAAC